MVKRLAKASSTVRAVRTKVTLSMEHFMVRVNTTLQIVARFTKEISFKTSLQEWAR